MLLLNQQQVETLLDLERLIEALAPAMVDLSTGAVSMPQRVVTPVPGEDGLLADMPVYVPSAGALSSKLVTVYPHNPQQGLPGHQALVLLFDPTTGTPLVLMDGTAITAMRTAAGSALATRLLARPESEVLVIVGAGVQAWSHTLAMPRVRPIRKMRIVARDEHKGRVFARRAAETLGIPAGYFDSFAAAADGADIICATTHSAEPVVFGGLVQPGTHINSVGLAYRGRELDAEAVLRSLVVVESRKAALADGHGGAYDLKIPIAEGLITADHLRAEIGEILAGEREGRSSPDQITLYKSVGVALQDAVAAGLVYQAALEQGTGIELDF